MSSRAPLTRYQRRLLLTIAQIAPGGFIPSADGTRVASRLVARGLLDAGPGGLALTPLGGAMLAPPQVPRPVEPTAPEQSELPVLAEEGLVASLDEWSWESVFQQS